MEVFLKKEVMTPIITVIICILLIIISKRVIYRIFNFKSARINDRKKKTILNLIGNIVKLIIILIGLLVILEVYGIDTKSLVASLGVVGLVVGLALQDLLKDLIIGMSIIFEGQYSIGDWVSINGFKGEILPSNLRTTKLKAYTGEIKIISNRNITELINYTMEKTNLIIDVDVAYESDIDKVKEVLDNLCKDMQEKNNLKSFECLGVQELSSSSIRFRLVANTNYLEQFPLDRMIKKEVVKEFAKNNITIPYNQVVVHNGQKL